MFENYIREEQVGRKKNKSAAETRSVVLFNCAEFKPRAVATITYREISQLLAAIRDGNPEAGRRPRPPTAARIHAHLGDFFGWCARERTIKEKPMANMPSPATVVARDRHYSDDELRAIWLAADQLDAVEGGYVKLMMLLALRRDELALARWTQSSRIVSPVTMSSKMPCRPRKPVCRQARQPAPRWSGTTVASRG